VRFFVFLYFNLLVCCSFLLPSGLNLIRDLTNGTLEGGTIGSTEITLTPGQINGGDYAVDTKTAGY
jgi:RNA 3'-terminal phosphate cyclase